MISKDKRQHRGLSRACTCSQRTIKASIETDHPPLAPLRLHLSPPRTVQLMSLRTCRSPPYHTLTFCNFMMSAPVSAFLPFRADVAMLECGSAGFSAAARSRWATSDFGPWAMMRSGPLWMSDERERTCVTKGGRGSWGLRTRRMRGDRARCRSVKTLVRYAREGTSSPAARQMHGQQP